MCLLRRASTFKGMLVMTNLELAAIIDERRARKARTSFSALETLHEADLEGQDRDPEEAHSDRHSHPEW